jgi:hypothetical protein
MNFPRLPEIYPSGGSASPAANAPAHRLDEFPAGHSSTGCPPAVPASASAAGRQYAVHSSCRSRRTQQTPNSALTLCVSPGGKRERRVSGFTGHTLFRTLAGRQRESANAIGQPLAKDPGSGLVPPRRSSVCSLGHAKTAAGTTISAAPVGRQAGGSPTPATLPG